MSDTTKRLRQVAEQAREPWHSRFVEKIDLDDPSGCWLWTAVCVRNGYAHFKLGSKMVYAHRVAYELLVGPIPEGLQLDHLCRVRRCVNPEHLEPVTQAENIRRGLSGGHNAIKTHCPQGHEYDDENTYVTPSGRRQCRTCVRERDRVYQARKRQKARAA